MNDLRPTLFLAQLSNLLAGNISIVHGVTGSSRTFMGEEAAGVDAVRIALARIAAGPERHRAGRRRPQRRAQGSAAALRSAARSDRATSRRYGSARRAAAAWRSARSAPSWCWRRASMPQARGAKPLARLSAVLSDRAEPQARRDRRRRCDGMWDKLAPELRPGAPRSSRARPAPSPRPGGARLPGSRADIAVRATGTHIGHGVEPQFPMNIALAAWRCGTAAVSARRHVRRRACHGCRRSAQVVVTSVGHWRGEGLALVEAVR